MIGSWLGPYRLEIRSVVVAGLLLALAGLGVPAGAAELQGVTSLSGHVPGGDREIGVTLWYPAGEGGTPVVIGDGPVFEGVEGRQDAPPVAGPFPVVLVSHGGARSAPGHGNWIGARLAARGFVVAIVRGPTLGPRDAALAVDEVWRRPADLRAALSILEEDRTWSGRLDRRRIGVVGFFLGGTGALSLAGARFDAARYMASCDEGGTGIDCGWYAESGIDPRSVDAESLTRSNLDPRIKVAVAVDPELAASFSPESLAAVAVPVEIVNLGSADAIPRGFRAAEITAAIPDARYHAVAGASRFSAFGTCKPQGPAILEEDGDDGAICRETGDLTRQTVHDRLAELIAGALLRGFEAMR